MWSVWSQYLCMRMLRYVMVTHFIPSVCGIRFKKLLLIFKKRFLYLELKKKTKTKKLTNKVSQMFQSSLDLSLLPGSVHCGQAKVGC